MRYVKEDAESTEEESRIVLDERQDCGVDTQSDDSKIANLITTSKPTLDLNARSGATRALIHAGYSEKAVEDTLAHLLPPLPSKAKPIDSILIADYAHGVVPKDRIQASARLAKTRRPLVFVYIQRW